MKMLTLLIGSFCLLQAMDYDEPRDELKAEYPSFKKIDVAGKDHVLLNNKAYEIKKRHALWEHTELSSTAIVTEYFKKDNEEIMLGEPREIKYEHIKFFKPQTTSDNYLMVEPQNRSKNRTEAKLTNSAPFTWNNIIGTGNPFQIYVTEYRISFTNYITPENHEVVDSVCNSYNFYPNLHGGGKVFSSKTTPQEQGADGFVASSKEEAKPVFQKLFPEYPDFFK